MTHVHPIIKKPPLTVILSLTALVVLLLLFSTGTRRIASANQQEQKEILTQAVTHSITQCYAIEGIYPPNLDYLETHYGLTYNKKLFYIDYQYIGSNIRPDVTVLTSFTGNTERN